MIKVSYIQCSRGGYHQGELLNIVCLNQQCKSNSLCCCVCVDELHKGHKTTTLKKMLIDSKEAGMEAQGQNKESAKQKNFLNNDIISNLIESEKKDTFEVLKIRCNKIRFSLQKIEQGLNEYYKQIQTAINQKDQENPSAKIFESIQSIQGASNLANMQSAVNQLLNSLELLKQHKKSKQNQQQLAQDSVINLIANSNREVVDSTINCLTDLQIQLQKTYQIITRSTNNVKNLFNKEIFYFSTELKSKDIWISDSYKVASKKGSQYQIALMEPAITSISDSTAFRFRITKNTSWIAFGMCHKNIIEKKSFTFDYKTFGHGCYMISTNAGSWSHISDDLNNKVKAFTFNEGDVVTCVVNKAMHEILFVKEPKQGLLASNQRQTYELSYIDEPNDQLHPCVVFYFENDQVDYLPATNLTCIPKYDYLFSDVKKHPRIKVFNSKSIKAIDQISQYRAALLNKSLEENFQIPKKFSFKIIKSTYNWVAVGMCHSKTAAINNYAFDFKGPFHGYYMISSNGGTWSTIDSNKNNVIRTFKFNQGDIVECQVVFGQSPTDLQNKIIFKKGSESYQLNFKGVGGDPLYPCAMLHYPNDQIVILPSF